jgi:hypothetical protein
MFALSRVFVIIHVFQIRNTSQTRVLFKDIIRSRNKYCFLITIRSRSNVLESVVMVKCAIVV